MSVEFGRFRRGSETEREPELGYSLIEVPVQAVGLDAMTETLLAPSLWRNIPLDIPFYRAGRQGRSHPRGKV
jgi:hypothetical protein